MSRKVDSKPQAKKEDSMGEFLHPNDDSMMGLKEEDQDSKMSKVCVTEKTV